MEEQTDTRERIAILFTLVLLVAFLGQVDIRPFSGYFRFSLSVPALALILLYFPSASPLLYSAIAGAVMLLLRGIIAAAGPEGMTLAAYEAQHAPVMIFYLTFGGLFWLLKVQQRSSRGIILFFLLFACEIAANLAELSLRHWSLAQPLERGVFFVVLIGLMRAGATAAVFRLSVYWQERHDRNLHEARYRRMLLFFSNIKTDLLFFRKSMDDIETAMKYSYGLYEKLRDGSLGEEALAVSRRIHEVKKEYQRIIVNMEKVLSGEYIEQPMLLSDIFALLQASTENFLAAKRMPVALSFTCHKDWLVRHYYAIISIVNNLVINAVEAMAGRPEGGRIDVSAHWEGADCILEVKDNGPGIAEDLLDCIFEPGFSTKFDPHTGAMSTGIGLAHVKNIVENHCGGRIIVQSSRDGTLFRILIPMEKRDGGDGA